jgi:hypothetical protein
VLFNFRCPILTQTFHRFSLQQLLYKRFGLRSNHTLTLAYFRPLNLAFEDVLVDLFDSLTTERLLTNQHFIEHYTQAPPIERFICCMARFQYLRRNVIRGTYYAVFPFFNLLSTIQRQSEVCELDVAITVQNDITLYYKGILLA